MNRIEYLFKNKRQNILSIYITAGYPEKDSTIGLIAELEKNGADMIEIGFPFSDPLADGPIIQQSSAISLKNGMNLALLFQQLKNIRKLVNIPLILMGYLNPVLQFGFADFCRAASEVGIDGLIIPDLPLEIYLDKYVQDYKDKELCYIPLITAHTEAERIKIIDKHTTGFLYLVSSSSTTGTKKISDENLEHLAEKISRLDLKNPTMVGFGINDKKSFTQVCQYANGGIIGSAFIKAIGNNKPPDENIRDFIGQIKEHTL